MKKNAENNGAKLTAQLLAKDTSTDTSRLHLATVRIQGYYQQEAAKINSEAIIQAAKISARARYFHGAATLLGAFGVFGGFAYRIYDDNKKIYEQTKELKVEIDKQDVILKELAESYNKLAEIYLTVGKNVEAKESIKKSDEITHRRKP